jgi:phage shock protein PspC (stress-responsive transcriptional regulator)
MTSNLILKITILQQNNLALKWIDSLRHFFEKHGFAVSSRFADRLGISVSNVRLFFIYISFVTLGFSFGIYLTLAFLLRLKDMIYTKRKSVFDL